MDFDLLQILQDQLAGLMSIIPNLVGALAVLLIGWIIARLLARFLRRLLHTLRVDRLAEKLNEIEIVYKSKVKLVPSAFLSKLVYYLLIFLTVLAATDVLGMQAVSDLMARILAFIPDLIAALIVLVVGILIADFLKNIVLTACQSLNIPAGKLISNVFFYFIFLNVVMITLKQVNLQTEFMENNISILLAGVVLAFAIGYGFASRDLMSNLLSSFYNKGKVRVGDVIGIEGVKGEVISIDNTSFVLRTENRRIVVPISKLSSEKYEVFEK